MKAPPAQSGFVSPDKLRLHKALTLLPRLAPADRARLKAEIKAHGQVIVPLLVTSGYEIIDGLNRWEIATEFGLRQVPIVVNDEIDPQLGAISTSVGRRQLTNSAIVVLLFEAHPHLRDEREARARSGLLRGTKAAGVSEAQLAALDFPTFTSLAERYDVPRKYFSYAVRLWTAYEPEGKWQTERDSILAGEVELPQAYAGLAGRAATKGLRRNVLGAPILLRESIHQFGVRAKLWQTLSHIERDKLMQQYQETLPKTPTDMLERMAGYLQEFLSNSGK